MDSYIELKINSICGYYYETHFVYTMSLPYLYTTILLISHVYTYLKIPNGYK